MMKITNGANTMTTSLGLYTSLYSKMGYKPVNEKKVEKPVEPIKTEKEVVTDAKSNYNQKKK